MIWFSTFSGILTLWISTDQHYGRLSLVHYCFDSKLGQVPSLVQWVDNLEHADLVRSPCFPCQWRLRELSLSAIRDLFRASPFYDIVKNTKRPLVKLGGKWQVMCIFCDSEGHLFHFHRHVCLPFEPYLVPLSSQFAYLYYYLHMKAIVKYFVKLPFWSLNLRLCKDKIG